MKGRTREICPLVPVLVLGNLTQDLFSYSGQPTILTLFHSHRRQGFGRTNTKSNGNLRAAAASGASTSSNATPPLPNLTHSTSTSSALSTDTSYSDSEPKRFFNEKYAKCSVKGNFLTLAAQPKNVERGEWWAHQCKVQRFQYRELRLTGTSG
jgi:hypothetical protein